MHTRTKSQDKITAKNPTTGGIDVQNFWHSLAVPAEFLCLDERLTGDINKTDDETERKLQKEIGRHKLTRLEAKSQAMNRIRSLIVTPPPRPKGN